MPDVIGEPIDRVEGRLRVTARATYTAERNIPNLAYAALHMSTVAKGRIVSINIAEAEHVRGVLAVMTHNSSAKTLAVVKAAMDSLSSAVDRKLQLLQDDRVYYANQPVAVAIADTLEAAQEAAQLVKVRYAP